jgi:TM2 domain-containing membrane protein YozV
MSSTSLEKRSAASGLVPAVASGIVPGLGQLLNGEGTKALGVFAIALVCGAGIFGNLLGWIPLIGGLAGVVGVITWIYAVADGYLTGRKRA